MALSDRVTAAMISQVRRMVNEVTVTTYDDDSITTYIAAYPRIDERGEKPYSFDTSTDPPTREDNDDWMSTFCLHSAASDIWEEKAAAVADQFDFGADGGDFTRSQKYGQYMAQARSYRSRRAATTINLIRDTRTIPSEWIGNLAEVD